jgi:hypothetical protein
MIIHNDGITNMINKMKDNQQSIICFGAGMMPYYIEDILKKYNLVDNIVCFTDNDPSKVGTHIKLGDRQYAVIEYSQVLAMDLSRVAILLTCETFAPVLQQLSTEEKLINTECYIYPMLNYDIFIKNTMHNIQLEKKPQLIPKIIHYCWFGGKPMPEICMSYIESWKKYCPDYEIKRWDESNYDVNTCLYIKQAYEAKMWAYVTDYARLDILYQYGGMYFDVDVEMIRNIDELLENHAFCAYGEWPAVNSGAGIGAIKGFELIREMRDVPRGSRSFITGNGIYDTATNSIYESAILRKYGCRLDFSMQNLNGMLVYPPDYFAPDSILGKDIYITKNTYAIHHCRGSWASEQRSEDKKATSLYISLENRP